MSSLALRKFKLEMPNFQTKELTHTFRSGVLNRIIGPSGVGKSTLISTLSLIRPQLISPEQIVFRVSSDSGMEFDYGKLSPEERHRLRQKYFGVCTQSYLLIEDLSCRDNVHLFGRLAGRVASAIEQEFHTFCKTLFKDDSDLQSRLLKGNCLPNTVSAGQRQRIGLLAALVRDPDILFLDEPTSNLDTANRNMITRLLTDWAAEKSCRRIAVMVTHDESEDCQENCLRME